YNHKCDIFSFGVICCELNWKIPADPDYLPRDNNFLILYDKLPICLSTTILAKIAQLATNENCSLRPEFSDIISIFKNSDDFMHLSDTQKVQTNININTSSSSSELDGGGDVFDQHLIRRRNSVFNNESRHDS
ncbi:dual specificity testis-specific protein kinase 2-like protein, partial [Leptotrombidium deliense]